MVPKNTIVFQVLRLVLLVIFAVSLIECKGSSHGGGSHGSSSHGGSHSSSGGSHSSYGGSHSSYGGSHSSYGGSHSSYGGGTHVSNNYGHSGGSPVGTHHVTNNVHVSNTHVTNTVHHPYQAHTVVAPGGGIHYHPAVQLHYSPPVHTFHTIPVYHPPPTIVAHSSHYDYNSGAHATNHFLTGYLIGRASGNLDHNTYHHHTVVHHYDDSDYYYTVHNHYQNSENVPTKFTIPGNSAVNCPENTSDALCVPNSDALCLRNETIMCVTSLNLTVPCGVDNASRCVFTRIECKDDSSCFSIQQQSYVDYFIPCLANVTLANNQVLDGTVHGGENNYELCVTAIAEPKKLESPVGSTVLLFQKLGLFALNELSDMNNKSVNELFKINQTITEVNNTLS